jgi:hypothetical protein
MLFAREWMEIEIITLSKMRQNYKDKYHMFLAYVEFRL